MSIKLSASLAAAAFSLVLLSGTAVASTSKMDAWAKEAFSDPCMNGDVPADGVVRADAIPMTDA